MCKDGAQNGGVMQGPNINNIIKDEENDVTYEIMAYRRLSKGEMVDAVRFYQSQKKTKKPKKGSTITIITIIGFNE